MKQSPEQNDGSFFLFAPNVMDSTESEEGNIRLSIAISFGIVAGGVLFYLDNEPINRLLPIVALVITLGCVGYGFRKVRSE